VCISTTPESSLPIIIYQRDNALFTPETVGRSARSPNVVGFKDGYGEIERLSRMRVTTGARLAFMNGMATAELSATAFFGVGVCNWSSAVLSCVLQSPRRSTTHSATARTPTGSGCLRSSACLALNFATGPAVMPCH
jgi:hypothetical protein